MLAAHCDAVGRDFDEITRSTNFNVVIASDESGVKAKLESLGDRYGTVIDVDGDRTIDRWFGGAEAAVGTPEHLVELIGTFKDAGMGYAIAYIPDAAYDPEAMDLFATEVMPHLR